MVLGAIKHRAALMCAQAAERKIGVFGRTQEEAGTVVRRIGEYFRAADGNFSGMRDDLSVMRGFALPPINDERAQDGCRASKPQPLIESAAGDGWVFSALLLLTVRCLNGSLLEFCAVFARRRLRPTIRPNIGRQLQSKSTGICDRDH